MIYNGFQIVETEIIGDPYEDWSRVRSPSRAKRRRQRGFAQRIVTRYRANGKVLHDKVRNVIYMHPHDRIKLEHMIGAR